MRARGSTAPATRCWSTGEQRRAVRLVIVWVSTQSSSRMRIDWLPLLWERLWGVLRVGRL